MGAIAKAAEFAVVFAFCCSAVFLIGYTVVAKWWRYLEGRAMVAMDVGIMLTLLPSCLHYWFNLNLSHPAFAWFDVCSIILVGCIALWRTWVVVTVQLAADRRRRAVPESAEASQPP